ncbi:hypothetical protein FOZ60_003237 [Perkinsus olseni]|uniref:Uncharacterized protein n=1 Tax=Perkinsus olseni TaxID=32597 RepID=A0A7J6NVW9_PEROL|nr:hypothetical protein FOZ60_003237 [Perkinsus olseni]
MRHPTLPWLLVAQALVITVAQDAGKYVHENRDFTMTYYVYEDHKVDFAFTLSGEPETSRPNSRSAIYSFSPGAFYVAWPFPLAEEASSVYTLHDDHSHLSFDDWYNTIKFLLANAGLVEPENLNPLAEIQPGDLATLTHYGKNSITTSFRKRELRFLRVTPTLTPGEYVYEGPLFTMTYDVNEDHEVTFSIYVPEPPLRRGDIPQAASISLGPYPLRSVTGFTYTLGFDKAGPDALDWRVELDRFFRNTGLMDYDESYPSAPSQEWDLTVVTYTSGHSIVTNFQEEKVEFKRVTRN